MPAASVLATIGNTPLVELKNLDTGGCRLFAKLENQNPTGSIKDRIGLSMIEAAERDRRLKPGGTLIESTAGAEIGFWIILIGSIGLLVGVVMLERQPASGGPARPTA